MDDDLFAHFLGKLKFAATTRLRFYHDGHESPSPSPSSIPNSSSSSNSRVGVGVGVGDGNGDEWCSEEEILRRIEELVSFELILVYCELN